MYFIVSKLLYSAHLRAEDEEVVGGDSVAPAGLDLVRPGQPGEGGHAYDSNFSIWALVL